MIFFTDDFHFWKLHVGVSQPMNVLFQHAGLLLVLNPHHSPVHAHIVLSLHTHTQECHIGVLCDTVTLTYRLNISVSGTIKTKTLLRFYVFETVNVTAASTGVDKRTLGVQETLLVWCM